MDSILSQAKEAINENITTNNGTLILTTGLISSNSIDIFLNRANTNKVIEVRSAKVESSTSVSRMTVIGVTDLYFAGQSPQRALPNKIPIKIEIYIDQSGSSLGLKTQWTIEASSNDYDAGSKWSLSDSFPRLIDTSSSIPQYHLDDISWLTVKITADSINANNLLAFSGDANVKSSPLFLAATLLTQDDHWTFQGTITNDLPIPTIDLKSEKITIDIGFLNLIELYLHLGTSFTDKNKTNAELLLELPFGIGPNTDITVACQLAKNDTSLNFHYHFEKTNLNSIDILTQTLNLEEGSISTLFSNELLPSNNFDLSELSLSIDRSENNQLILSSVSATLDIDQPFRLLDIHTNSFQTVLTVGFPDQSLKRYYAAHLTTTFDKWSIIADILSIESLRIELFSQLNSGESGVSNTKNYGLISGNIALLEELSIDIDIPLPITNGPISIQSKEPFDLPDLSSLNHIFSSFSIETLLPGDFSNIGGFTINSIGLNIDPHSRTINDCSIIFSSTSPWKIISNQLELSGIHAEIYIEDPTTDRRITGRISGNIAIENIIVNIEISRTELDSDWQLIINAPPISLPTLDKLTELVGSDISEIIPKSLLHRNFILSDIRMEVDFGETTHLSDFHFKLSTESDSTATDLLSRCSIALDFGLHWNKEIETTISGQLQLGDIQFDILFSENESTPRAIAVYQSNTGLYVELKTLLIENIPPPLPDLQLLDGISVELHNALLGYQGASNNGETSKFLFGLDMGTSLNLSNLPMVGKAFPPEKSINLAYRIIVSSSEGFTPNEVSAFNTLLPSGVPQLPTKKKNGEEIAIGSLDIDATLQLGNNSIHLDLPVSPLDGTSNNVDLNDGSTDSTAKIIDTNSATNSDTTSIDAGTKWINLQKSFGPVHFERIGAQYQKPDLWFLLDASLVSGGLTISLDGLGVGSPLDHFDPTFSLNGIGIDYHSGPLEVGGAFLKEANPPANVEFAYDGKALLKTKALSLSAIGSYAKLKGGDPSLFLYAVLDYPLGGPAFFFVTGLAAGFGYNRKLTSPAISEVATFPLVAEVTGGLEPSTDLTKELERFNQYITPQAGDSFIAAGVKFTSFKMIDSFALLTVAFGEHFEVDVMGLSTLVAPTPEKGKKTEPLAKVQMALKASFQPEQGFLGVEAQLTSASYILSKQCHLLGGFAFYSWLSGPHEGDFVTTLGGFHPSYHVPSHYPTVPRLSFKWDIDNVTIKGNAYYALTPHALMAGGHLDATYRDGHLKAWFKAGADFLVAWQPYHYDARMSVEIGANYETALGDFSIDLGAKLHLWGPNFAGTAHIDWTVISFDVDFGDRSRPSVKAISWTQFEAAFLPNKKDICSIAIQGGLLQSLKVGEQQRFIVNPKTLSFATHSILPSKQAFTSPGENGEIDINFPSSFEDFGIGPMSVSKGSLSTSQTVCVLKEIPSINDVVNALNLPQAVIESVTLQAAFANSGTTVKTIHEMESNQWWIIEMNSPPHVSLLRDNAATESSIGFTFYHHVEEEFVLKPQFKNVPSGMWGHKLQPSINDEGFIKDTLSGFAITPAKPVKPGNTQRISRSQLRFETLPLHHSFSWETIPESTLYSGTDTDNAIDRAISSTKARDSRASLLNALGFSSDELSLDNFSINEFVISPTLLSTQVTSRE